MISSAAPLPNVRTGLAAASPSAITRPKGSGQVTGFARAAGAPGDTHRMTDARVGAHRVGEQQVTVRRGPGLAGFQVDAVADDRRHRDAAEAAGMRMRDRPAYSGPGRWPSVIGGRDRRPGIARRRPAADPAKCGRKDVCVSQRFVGRQDMRCLPGVIAIGSAGARHSHRRGTGQLDSPTGNSHTSRPEQSGRRGGCCSGRGSCVMVPRCSSTPRRPPMQVPRPVSHI